MHDTARTANLLGAVALAVTDLAVGGATRAAGVSSSGAAALVTLAASPGLSVTELGRRVGLSQPAAARMVDSLEADGLVERRRSAISRGWVTVHPTGSGTQAASRILAARGGPLADLVDVLAPEDQQALARLLSALLDRAYERIGRSQYICRICDRASCQTDATCPVGDAERRSQDEGEPPPAPGGPASR